MSEPIWRQFGSWRQGVIHALDGGLWLHPFRFRGERWAHLVSSDRLLLVRAGERLGMRQAWLQYRPIKDPRTGQRVPAWHWDLRGQRLEHALRWAAPRVPPPRDRRAPPEG